MKLVDGKERTERKNGSTELRSRKVVLRMSRCWNFPGVIMY